MTLTVTSKRLPDEQPWEEDAQGRRKYTEVFEVDQTDGGALAAGVAVAAAAQLLVSGDPLPLRGDNYSYGGTTDTDAYVLSFSGRRPKPNDYPKRWHITVTYGPPDGDPGSLSETDPLSWPVEYWLESLEVQVPVETAKNVDDLSHIGRTAGTDGPIVNSCGQQPIDPYLKTVHYPILCCQKAYADLTDIITLNATYENTVNDDSYYGASARKAKYIYTDSGRLQQTQGTSYYLGVTRILFKELTHDLKVLNNGFNHFTKVSGSYVQGSGSLPDGNPFQSLPKLSRFLVFDDFEDATNDVPSSEPMNLELDGTPRPPDDPALNLTFRYLTEVDYDGLGV